MTIDEKFEKWFDEKFPESSFGNLAGVFRLAIKTDIAKKAFIFGLQSGLDSGFDQKLQDQVDKVMDY